MSVLVVDDSPVDRRLAGRLLEKQGFAVRYAGDGDEALVALGAELPDIVVTDLLMPHMNGLELVETARRRYPAVPVILMTAHGSEDTAVAALRKGAASYVPKRNLARELVSTVTEVLALSRPEEQQVYEALRELEARFSIDNQPSSLAPLVRHLESLLVRMGLGDETDCIQVAVALREALTNAVEHGNLELPSALKDAGGYDAQAAYRRAHVPWCDRRVDVRVRMSRDAVEYVVSDEGRGFDRALLPDPTDPANLEKSHGRGLMLIGTFMDEVRHNDRGNTITMIKRRRAVE